MHRLILFTAAGLIMSLPRPVRADAVSFVPELRQVHDVTGTATNLVIRNPFGPQTPTVAIRFLPRVQKDAWTPPLRPTLNGRLLVDEPLSEGWLQINPGGDAQWQYVAGLAPYRNPGMLQKPHWQKVFHDPLTPRDRMTSWVAHGQEPGYVGNGPMGFVREPRRDGGQLALIFDRKETGRCLSYRIPSFGDGLIQAVRATYYGGGAGMKFELTADPEGKEAIQQWDCPVGGQSHTGGPIAPRCGPLFAHFIRGDATFTTLSQLILEADVDYGAPILPRLDQGDATLVYAEDPKSSGRARIKVELVTRVLWEAAKDGPVGLTTGGQTVTQLANGQRLAAPAVEVKLPGAVSFFFSKPEDLAGCDGLCAEVRYDPGCMPPGARLLGYIDAERTHNRPSYAYADGWHTINVPVADLAQRRPCKGVSVGGLEQTSPPQNAAPRMLVRRVWLTRGTPPARTDHSAARLDAARKNFLDRPPPPEAAPPGPQGIWKSLFHRPPAARDLQRKAGPVEDFWPWGVWMGWNTVCQEFNVSKAKAFRAIFADLRRNGFNAVFLDLPGWPEIKPWLNLAERMGIRYWMQGPRYFGPPWTEARAKEFYTPEMEKSLAEFSRHVGDRWGILSYEFVEEIGPQDVPRFTPYYRLMEKYFPNQPGVVVHNNDPAFTEDVRLNRPRFSARDHYPFRIGWTRHMYDYYGARLIKSARDAADAGTRWWLVAQSCYSVGEYWGYTEPTTAQVLVQVWNGIGLGAKGVWFYSYVIPRAPMERIAADLASPPEEKLPAGDWEGCCFKNYDGSDTPQWKAMGDFIRRITPHLPLLLKCTWSKEDAAGSKQKLVKTYTHTIAGRPDRVLIAVNEDWDQPLAAGVALKEAYRDWKVTDLMAGRALDAGQLAAATIPPGEGLLLLLEAPKTK